MLTLSLNELEKLENIMWDGCMLISQEGVIVYITNACARLFGYTRNEMSGGQLAMILPDHVKEKHKQYVYDNTKHIENYVMGKDRYVHGKCKDDSSIPLEIRLNSCEVDGVRHILAVCRDKSQEIKLLSELDDARTSLQKTLDSKTMYIANMSHELRGPLNGIMGSVSLLMNGGSQEEQKMYMETIEESSKMLLATFNNVIDHTSLEQKEVQILRTDVNIRVLCSEIKKYFETSVMQKGLGITCEICNVPEQVSIDELRIRQVICNIISNSIKFTHNGGMIRMRIRYDDSVLTFEVCDNGIGIDAQQSAKLFQPFAQANETIVHNFGGSGLGLSICKSLVESMGGKISIKSEKNIGTTVMFTVPVLHQTKAFIPHVVIIEDHEVNRFVLKKFLEKLSYVKVSSYKNGKEALDKMLMKPNELPSIIFMDLYMPYMNGYECTKGLRKAGVKVPVIAITGVDMSDKKAKMKEYGLNDYLMKPFSLDGVRGMMEKWCSL